MFEAAVLLRNLSLKIPSHKPDHPDKQITSKPTPNHCSLNDDLCMAKLYKPAITDMNIG